MNNLIKTRRVSVVRYQAETLNFRDRVTANAGTISTSSLAAVDKFVAYCKTHNLWAKLTDVGVFVGNQLAAALVKLKFPVGGDSLLFNSGFIAADYTETGANGGLTSS